MYWKQAPDISSWQATATGSSSTHRGIFSGRIRLEDLRITEVPSSVSLRKVMETSWWRHYSAGPFSTRRPNYNPSPSTPCNGILKGIQEMSDTVRGKRFGQEESTGSEKPTR